MERSLGLYGEEKLPGYDALSEKSMARLQSPDLGQKFQSDQYHDFKEHTAYLTNTAYKKYLQMHKVLVGSSGAHELLEIADSLGQEELPRFLDAAGWAYAEAGLALENESAVDRLEYILQAEQLWCQSMEASLTLENDASLEYLHDEVGQFRSALAVAHAPLLKSIIVGNVSAGTRERVLMDTLAVAQASGVQMELALRSSDFSAASEHVGLLHETNALLTLHYLDNPRYIALPSTARADTGYYHREQTHDITIINQHWGKIRKVIPLEVKSRATVRDRARYKALIIRGKMHLSINGDNDPRHTLDAFSRVYENGGDKKSQRIVDHASSTMLRLLKLYQQGSQLTTVNADSATRFHDNRYVTPRHKR